MISKCKRKEIDLILTKSISRFGRNTLDMPRLLGDQAGLREGSGYAEFVCSGHKRGDDGSLVIDEPEAKIVRAMFEMRAAGCSLGTISKWLYENKIASPTGRATWSRETISKLLKSEKCVRDVLLQKTFVADLFSGKRVKNKGELEKFLIHEHHPTIISKELFKLVNHTNLNSGQNLIRISIRQSLGTF